MCALEACPPEKSICSIFLIRQHILYSTTVYDLTRAELNPWRPWFRVSSTMSGLEITKHAKHAI